MSVRTTYDEMRDDLREHLEEALKMARVLFLGVDDSGDYIWGFDQIREEYPLEVLTAVTKAKNSV